MAQSEARRAPSDDWNRVMSRAFLHAAVEGYAEDASDGEGGPGAKARTMRIKVICAWEATWRASLRRGICGAHHQLNSSLGHISWS
jgi:hypothetical protein